MPRSEAQKRADKKYHAKTYKRVAVNVKQTDFPRVDEYMKEHDIKSYSAFFNDAVNYIIDNCIDISTETASEPTHYDGVEVIVDDEHVFSTEYEVSQLKGFKKIEKNNSEYLDKIDKSLKQLELANGTQRVSIEDKKE